MQLDLTTLHITHVSNFILLGVVLCMLGWRYRHEPSLLIWGIGTLLACAGQLLIAAREIMPQGISVALGNASLFAAMTLSWLGLVVLQGKQAPWRYGIMLAAIPSLLILLPGLGSDAINQRVAIFVAATLGFNLLLMVTALRANSRRRLGGRLLAGLSAMLVLMYLYRAYLLSVSEVGNILATKDYLDTMFASLTLETARVLVFMYLCFERLETRLTDMREMDIGTGLPNMLAFSAYAIDFLAKPGQKALLLASVDDLDKIRGLSGRSWHDQMLADISNQLRQVVHPLTSCYGKHEDYFAVLLPAGKLSDVLARLQAIHHPSLGQISFSCGITVHEEPGLSRTSIDQLLLEAELALQDAQHKGRGQVCHADKEAIRALSEC